MARFADKSNEETQFDFTYWIFTKYPLEEDIERLCKNKKFIKFYLQ